MIVLPKERSKAKEYDDISKLCIVAHQGTGKTHLCAQLPNSLLIDFEDGCKDYYEGASVNLKKEASKNNITIGAAFMATIKAIKEANVSNGSPVYDFIIFDGITAMEKITHQKATAMFKTSVVGKGMINKGAVIQDVVTDVPESGWLWLHRAWEELYTDTVGLANIATVYLAHAKQGSLVKQGLKLDANDMALTGKLKLSFLRDIDACGMLYRDGNVAKLSFKTNEKDLTTKSRARHLNEAEFVISELVEGKLKTYWDLVFPQLKK